MSTATTSVTATPYKPTEWEKATLNHLGVALRPEWIGMPPAAAWAHHLQEIGGFEHAEDFAHVVRAFTAYATGQHAGQLPRTPNLFVINGPHWFKTRLGEDHG